MNSSYLNSAAGAFLGILFVVMTLSIVSEGIYEAPVPETEGFMIEVAEGGGEARQCSRNALRATPTTRQTPTRSGPACGTL